SLKYLAVGHGACIIPNARIFVRVRLSFFFAYTKAVIKWSVGIDEAGRGPLAGPVAVGAVIVPRAFDWERIPGVGDSKKVAPKNREAIFRRVQNLKKNGELNFCVRMVSPSVIDRIGITNAVSLGIQRAC